MRQARVAIPAAGGKPLLPHPPSQCRLMTLFSHQDDVTSSTVHASHTKRFIDIYRVSLDWSLPRTVHLPSLSPSERGKALSLAVSFSDHMAATEPEPQSQRKWVPATVGLCHWQTATDRVGYLGCNVTFAHL